MDWELVTMVGTVVSAVAHFWAARGLFGASRARHRQIQHIYTAIMSLGYFLAFGAIRFGDVDRGEWSEFMTPVSALVFFTVWALPAGQQVMETHAIDRASARAAAALQDDP